MTEGDREDAGARALARGKRRTLIGALAFVGLMLGMAYAAVPLYRLFCQVTGFGGTPLRAEAMVPTGAEDAAGAATVSYEGAVASDREITVFFDANVNDGLPWDFEPTVGRMTVRVGEPQVMYYRAANRSDEPVSGTATFNVEPEQMGGYFVKIDCFCFQEQVLQPGESIEMPVYYFVHADILEDAEMIDQQTVTLSYTFFRRDDLASSD